MRACDSMSTPSGGGPPGAEATLDGSPDGCRHPLNFAIGQRGVNRNLDRLAGALGIWRSGWRKIRKQRQVRADVHVQRFDVDAASNAPLHEIVPIRHVGTVLIVHMSA